MRLFVYGTLMDPACVERLTGRRFPARAATLHGWKRTVPPGGYPVIDPSPDDRVEGLVIDGIDAAALHVLDAYENEGRLYARRPVVAAVGGVPVPCDAYVGAGHCSSSCIRYCP